jgi:membrane-bound lytic murein transglycosylase MltF
MSRSPKTSWILPQGWRAGTACFFAVFLLAACEQAPETPPQESAPAPQSSPGREASPAGSEPEAPAEAEAQPPSLAEALVSPLHTDDLPAIRSRRELRVLVTYSPTDFFFDDEGTARGLQVELLREYEKALNKGIRRREKRTRIIYIPTTFDRLIPDLIAGKGDIAAAMLTITPERQARVAFATGKAMEVNELVVTGRNVTGIEDIEDLSGRSLYVVRGSSYAEHLRELNREFAQSGLAPVDIQEADSHLLSGDILQLVNSGVVDVTVVDDYAARQWAQVLPDIRVLEDIRVTTGNTLGWAVRKDNPELLRHLNAFARKMKQGTLTGNILFRRYHENTKWISDPTEQAERNKLDLLLDLFREYAGRYDFDHLAIAAQAYQESRLEHDRKSPRGAVGVMQVLPSTAADPNVAIERIDELENNIHAGVRYLAFLRDRYFSDPEISPLDRNAFSWAAYNAGPAKVRKMRQQAAKMGLDPNIWFSNVEVAAARMVGREPVQYVSNIYKYYVAYRLVADRTAVSF